MDLKKYKTVATHCTPFSRVTFIHHPLRLWCFPGVYVFVFVQQGAWVSFTEKEDSRETKAIAVTSSQGNSYNQPELSSSLF